MTLVERARTIQTREDRAAFLAALKADLDVDGTDVLMAARIYE
jgi:hypothetical protein